MLSQQSLPVIRATLPVVAESIGEITKTFYIELFDAHPELLRDLFNRGNQRSGEQQKALAGSIAAFAAMLIDNPDSRPDALLGRIANKHASLGITPDQYKIVHRHLFSAIGKVLGDAVTDEVAQAWDEVYWLMANALIAIEERLYRSVGAADGDVWRHMKIVERHDETSEVASFLLEGFDGEPAGPFLPGQYVSVQVELPDGARQIRQYSLSHKPTNPRWRITVKRVDAGVNPAGEVSTWLHTNAKAGDVLTVSAPFGDLVLPPEGDGPLLLVSAGIGSTPMLAMLDQLAGTSSNRPVTVVHADRSASAHAHREDQRRCVEALPGAVLHLWYDQPEGETEGHRIGPVDLAEVAIPDEVTVYLCGPLPFMRDIRSDLIARGVSARDIHYEVFGPDMWLTAS